VALPPMERTETAAAAVPATDLEARVVSEALEAARLFEEMRSHPAADGWNFYQRKEDVDIFMNVRADGTGTWGMGVGRIDAAVDTVKTVHEVERYKAVLDKQWEMTTPLGSVPGSLIRVPGWDIVECTLQQNLYRSPAWPVSPRESCTLVINMRSRADGAYRTLQRSIDVPGCVPPAGYTRVSLAVGGFALTPLSPRSCEMLYLNILDPNGSIPKVVVKRTVPERCLSVARARKCAAQLAKEQ